MSRHLQTTPDHELERRGLTSRVLERVVRVGLFGLLGLALGSAR